MSFSMSGGDKWGYTYSRFAKLDAQKEAPEAVEAVEAEVQEESIEEGYAKYQEGGEVKKSDVKKDEKECEKCKGKGCDHCKGKGKHEVRWQDSDGDGKWYEKGEDVAEEATIDESNCGGAAKYQEGGEVKASDIQYPKGKKQSFTKDKSDPKVAAGRKAAKEMGLLKKEDVFSAEELTALSEQVGISEEQLDEVLGAVLAGVGDAIGGAAKGAGSVVKGVTDAAGNVAGSVTRGVKKAITGKNEKEIEAENQVKVREGVEDLRHRDAKTGEVTNKPEVGKTYYTDGPRAKSSVAMRKEKEASGKKTQKEELEATGLFTAEEIENLVELSTDTLNSYMDKADKEREAAISKAKDQKIKSREAAALGKDKKAKKLDKKALNNYSKAEKRDDSVDQAYAKVQKAQGTESDLLKKFPPKKGANVPAQKSNMLSRAKAKVRRALRKEDLEATGLFSAEEIDRLIEDRDPTDAPTNKEITKQGAERENAVAKLMQNKEMQAKMDAAIAKSVARDKARGRVAGVPERIVPKKAK